MLKNTRHLNAQTLFYNLHYTFIVIGVFSPQNASNVNAKMAKQTKAGHSKKMLWTLLRSAHHINVRLFSVKKAHKCTRVYVKPQVNDRLQNWSTDSLTYCKFYDIAENIILCFRYVEFYEKNIFYVTKLLTWKQNTI